VTAGVVVLLASTVAARPALQIDPLTAVRDERRIRL